MDFNSGLVWHAERLGLVKKNDEQDQLMFLFWVLHFFNRVTIDEQLKGIEQAPASINQLPESLRDVMGRPPPQPPISTYYRVNPYYPVVSCRQQGGQMLPTQGGTFRKQGVQVNRYTQLRALPPPTLLARSDHSFRPKLTNLLA